MKYLPAQSEEAIAAVAAARSAIPGLAALSFMVSLLPIGMILFVLLIVDVALPGRSFSTLLGILLMLALLMGFHATFVVLRLRLLTRVADLVSEQLTPRLDEATAQLAEAGRGDINAGMQVTSDIDAIQHFLRSGAAGRWIDMTSLPVALIAMNFLHYWLALALLLGATGLTILLRFSIRSTRGSLREMVPLRSQRNTAAEVGRQHPETLRALGMRKTVRYAWTLANIRLEQMASRWQDTFALRLVVAQLVQVALFAIVLAIGAALAMSDRASAAVALAAGMLAWLALDPFVQAFARTEQFINAQQGWARIDTILHSVPLAEERVALPPPKAKLACENIALAAPGMRRPLLQGVHFALEAGQALAIIGPSGSGKSTLLRALTGAWPINMGKVRLDNAALDQWSDEALGRHVGYLPQTIDLFTGTVAENIARFDPAADPELVVRAAQDAGVHEMIVRLPEGYSTQIGLGGSRLSLSQVQRIGLARAFYGRPFLLVLDTPTAHCDASGERDFLAAIAKTRQRGALVVIAGTQACIIRAASHVLVLRDGTQSDFGEKDDLRQRLQDQDKPEAMDQSGDGAVPSTQRHISVRPPT